MDRWREDEMTYIGIFVLFRYVLGKIVKSRPEKAITEGKIKDHHEKKHNGYSKTS